MFLIVWLLALIRPRVALVLDDAVGFVADIGGYTSSSLRG